MTAIREDGGAVVLSVNGEDRIRYVDPGEIDDLLVELLSSGEIEASRDLRTIILRRDATMFVQALASTFRPLTEADPEGIVKS